MSTFIVVSKCARMPASCWGRYKRVAVVEVIDPAIAVPAIDARRKNVVRIVRTWEKLNAGSTERCAYSRALAEARALATELNAAAKKSA